MISVFKTKLGWVGVTATHAGISRIILPRRRRKEVLRLLERGETNSPLLILPLEGGGCRWGCKLSAGFTQMDLKRAERDILRYLNGERINFDYPLDLEKLSPFTLKVLRVAKTISYGQARSYLWVARKLGNKKLSRAVGQALAKNPLPVMIPCHRVIRANGDTGGFAGGALLKKTLLKRENM